MPVRDQPHAKELLPDAVLESPRRVALRDEVDVLVCGGGPAGVGAAWAAARLGARTLLLERWGQLGGVWTAGLLNPFFEATGRGWLGDELVAHLTACGAWRRWKFSHCFDTETLRRELETLLSGAGVELLYQTLVTDAVLEGDRLRGVIIESKAGREAVLAKVVIDATGDGDVAARAGCRYELGRPVDGLVQPLTLMFEVSGVGDWIQPDAPTLFDELTAAAQAAGLDWLPPIERCNYAPWIINTPAPGVADVQLTHVYRVNPLDPAAVTRATVSARRQAAEAVAVLRHLPQFADLRLTHTAAAIGIREARRVVGQYTLSLDDLVAGQRFDDAVTSCAFGVDIHEPAPGAGVPTAHHTAMRPYEIPYRCLLPADVGGLLLAGRLISGTHEAHASYRVTGTCFATGQAAGLAAAWAAAEGTTPDRLDGRAVRQKLQQQGVRLLD
ncbi:MAG: FAD-dependent oxidoreductase [Fimbriimonadaceae bacterium]|nr:FAD-dependent oxidoreductase [Fimbriimonadaceae bacterium]